MEKNFYFQKIVERYNNEMDTITEKRGKGDRAKGGFERSHKGKMVEDITKDLIRASWSMLGGDNSDMDFLEQKKYKIHIQQEYIDKFKDEEIKKYLLENKDDMFFRAGQDIHVGIKKTFILSIECKAYTENAMFKRILFDAFLMKQAFPNLSFALVQLESQLTGDYSQLGNKTFGSKSTHTLASFFPDIDIQIITLLKGERKVDEPIHKREYFKPLEIKNLETAAKSLSNLLKEHL